MKTLTSSLLVLSLLILAPRASAQAPDVEPLEPDTPPTVPVEGSAGVVEVEADDATATAPAAELKVGWLELDGPIREGAPPIAIAGMAAEEPSLREVLAQLKHVAESDDHAGLVIYVNAPALSLAQIESLVGGIEAIRDAGKPVLAFSEAYDTRGYLLAAACDRVLLQKKGGLGLQGLAVEEYYLAGLLEKIGVKAELEQIGRFKGADEAMTRSGPSEAWNQNIDGLLDDMYAQLVNVIALRRDLKPAAVEKLLGEAWMMTDQQLLKAKAIDAIVDRDMQDQTGETFGDDFAWDTAMGRKTGGNTQAMSNPFAIFQVLFQSPKKPTTRDTIAVIKASGAIHSGESSTGDGFFSSDSIGAETMRDALAEVRDDPNIKGVIIRMDSPGGSALASEMIWQSAREVAEAGKPVWISINGMAASGGYYIAAAADKVYVAPQSIVGSIGVVGGKLTLDGTMEKLDIHVYRRSRGPNADMFGSAPFTDDQRKKLRKALGVVYDQFTGRVEDGRGDKIKDIDQVAQGRLFTGRQAVKNGLADALGGLEVAITDLAGELELTDGGYDVIDLPAPMSLGEFLESIFGTTAAAPMSAKSALTGDASQLALLQLARRVLGEPAWTQATRTLDGLMLLKDEPALMLMPTAVVVK